MGIETNTNSSLQDWGRRWSGVELLKIFAILLIVTCHAVSTLQNGSAYINNSQEYILNISIATTNPQQFFISLMKYAGAFGNSIFFVSSAWFLLENKSGGQSDSKRFFALWQMHG